MMRKHGPPYTIRIAGIAYSRSAALVSGLRYLSDSFCSFSNEFFCTKQNLVMDDKKHENKELFVIEVGFKVFNWLHVNRIQWSLIPKEDT